MTRRLAPALPAAAALLTFVPGAPAQETDPDLPVPWLSEARVGAVLPGAGSGTDAGTGSAARLRATYRFRPGLDTARLTAMRIEGARVELVSVSGVSAETASPTGPDVRWRLDTLPGLLRLRVPGPARDSLTLSWRVVGAGERLPLFVPETPTRPAESLVRLQVTGGTGGVAADRAFPRMRAGQGGLVGRPENLPSFLRLPSREDRLTVDRVADWSVVFLVLLATGWWVWWRWAASRRRARRETRSTPAGEDHHAGSPGPGGGR